MEIRYRSKRLWCVLSGLFAVLGLVSCAVPPQTHIPAPLALELPLDCIPGNDCHVVRHFDHKPGAGYVDYACGLLTRDGSTTTAFAVPAHERLFDGVEVHASMYGYVSKACDPSSTKPELTCADYNAQNNTGYVRVVHDGGWETDYKNLLPGGITVKPGDFVRTGSVLGLLDPSVIENDHAHLDFGVYFNGEPIDPFVGTVDFYNCNYWRAPVWSTKAYSLLNYHPLGALVAGFSLEEPEPDKARRGYYNFDEVLISEPEIYLWVEYYGAKVGDIEEFMFVGPDNQIVTQERYTVRKPFPSRLAYHGMYPPSTGWKQGEYTFHFRLKRRGEYRLLIRKTLKIKPLQLETKPF